MQFMLFLCGSILASFFMCLTDEKHLLGFRRSQCDHCHHSLSIFNLFPIISYIITKGRCNYCQKWISIHYLLGEISGALIGLAIYFIPITNALTLFQVSLVLWWLFFIAIYDIYYLEVPWTALITLSLLCLPLIQNIMLPLILWICFEILLNFRPHWIGGADIIIIPLLSMTLSPLEMPYFILWASIIGILFLVFQLLTKKYISGIIPFVPCIALSYLGVCLL